MLSAKTFYIPPVLVIGSGASEQVGEESRKLGVEKGLIVTDEVLLKLGILDNIKQSKSLMADVPRAFMMVAKKRGNRVAKLRSLLGKEV